MDQGADPSRGTPCEPMKSAFRWAEEAHGDDELLSIHAKGFCDGEAAFFFFFGSGIGGSAAECMHPGCGRRPLILF